MHLFFCSCAVFAETRLTCNLVPVSGASRTRRPNARAVARPPRHSHGTSALPGADVLSIITQRRHLFTVQSHVRLPRSLRGSVMGLAALAASAAPGCPGFGPRRRRRGRWWGKGHHPESGAVGGEGATSALRSRREPAGSWAWGGPRSALKSRGRKRQSPDSHLSLYAEQ